MNSNEDCEKDTNTKMTSRKNVSVFLLGDQSSTTERLEDEEEDLIEQIPILDDDEDENEDLASNEPPKNFHQLIQVELESLHQHAPSNNKMMLMAHSPEALNINNNNSNNNNEQDVSFPDTQDTDLDVAEFNAKSPNEMQHQQTGLGN